jgi:hypothetical protein
MPQNLRWQDWAALIPIILSLAGLIWSASEQVSVNAQQGRDIARIDQSMDRMDSAQREDHIAIVRMQSGIEYLVDRAKEREGKK